MLNRLLSHDLPKSRWLAAALILIVLALAVAPFLFPGSKPLGVAAKMLVFILLVASYDLLLGYTGIVSFAHTMFFGIGACGIAIASTRLGPTWPALGLGIAAALATSLVLALLIGLFVLVAGRAVCRGYAVTKGPTGPPEDVTESVGAHFPPAANVL